MHVPFLLCVRPQQDFSDRIECEPENSPIVQMLESFADKVGVKGWDKRLPPELLADVTSHRR